MSPLSFAAGALYALWLLPMTFYDLLERRIPDTLTYSCAAVLLLFRIFIEGVPPVPLFAGMGGCLLFLFIFRGLMKGGLGLGDIKLSASSGILLPGISWLSALTAAALLALVTVLPFIALGRIDRRSRIPFAPFLGAGTLAAFFLSYHGLNPLG